MGEEQRVREQREAKEKRESGRERERERERGEEGRSDDSPALWRGRARCSRPLALASTIFLPFGAGEHVAPTLFGAGEKRRPTTQTWGTPSARGDQRELCATLILQLLYKTSYITMCQLKSSLLRFNLLHYHVPP